MELLSFFIQISLMQIGMPDADKKQYTVNRNI